RLARLRAERAGGVRAAARRGSGGVRVLAVAEDRNGAAARRRRLPARGAGLAADGRARGMPRASRASDREPAAPRGGGAPGAGARVRGAEDDRRVPRRAPDRGLAPALAGARGERGDRRPAPCPGALWVRRRRPAPSARRPRVAEAGARALRRDGVRASPLLPVRPGGGLA